MVRLSFVKGLIEERMSLKDWIVEIIWYNKFSCFLRKIGRFILRLIRWIPLLYKQEEWDYSYIYDILEMKMKELRKLDIANMLKQRVRLKSLILKALIYIEISHILL